jgi:hypothetical protein
VRFINGHGWKYWTTGQIAEIPEYIAKEFKRDRKVDFLDEDEQPEANDSIPAGKDFQTPVDRAIHESPVTPTIRAQDYSLRRLTMVIKHMNSIPDVEAFLTSEMTNTEYPGGRSTAIKLIRKRLEDLKTE